MNEIDDWKRIQQLLPPPELAPESTPPWSEIEAELGLVIPSDYKRLVETYGRGKVDDCFWWYAGSPAIEWREFSRQFIKLFCAIKEPEEYDVEFYPTPGGLLPIASNDNTYTICWQTEGSPEEWPIVWWDPNYLTINQTPHRSFLAALIEILEGKSKFAQHFLPGAIPGAPHHFQNE